MQIKSQNKQAFEEGRNYAKKLEMVVTRDAKNVRKNNNTINDKRIMFPKFINMSY